MSSKPIYKRKVVIDTASFIKKAREVHGDKYDYSESVFVSAHDKIDIWCYDHGWFSQSSSSHTGKGAECPKCAAIKKNKKQADKFIRRAMEVHGDKYDYTKVEYIGSKDKVIIICKEEGHGEFSQTPYAHIRGTNCPICNRGASENGKVFIERAKRRHGDKFDYADVNYVNAHTKVKIYCNKHKIFFQQGPRDHITGAGGCPSCLQDGRGDQRRLTREEFIKRSIEIHGNRYDYDRVVYRNNSTPVEIICPEHGSFFQAPVRHMGEKQSECQKCAQRRANDNVRITTEEFIRRSREVHGNKFDYSKSVMKGLKNYITVICPHHGEIQQFAGIHMRGAGCRYCGYERNSAISTLKPETMHLPAILYHVEFERIDGSRFEKLGVTIHTPEVRFYKAKKVGLEMRIVDQIKTTLAECIEMEETLFEMYHDHRYRVHDLKDTEIGGWTECFPPNIVSLFNKSPDGEEEILA